MPGWLQRGCSTRAGNPNRFCNLGKQRNPATFVHANYYAHAYKYPHTDLDLDPYRNTYPNRNP